MINFTSNLNVTIWLIIKYDINIIDNSYFKLQIQYLYIFCINIYF